MRLLLTSYVASFFRAVLFQILLTTFGFGLSLIASLAGVQLVPFMLNPIFESSCPSDFWGRRWNLVGMFHYRFCLELLRKRALTHDAFVFVQFMEF
jgi:hypothetical protein